MKKTASRASGIDLFRFVGAFFIMLLHTDYGSLAPEIENTLRLSGRWAVPFFFIVSGYFMAPKLHQRVMPIQNIEKTLLRLFWILLVASLFYFMLNSYFQGEIVLRLEQLITGTNFHLWFLGSLIFGYLSIWFMYRLNKGKYAIPVAITILIIALYTDSYDVIFGHNKPYVVFRFLLSIPFMLFGILMAKLNFLKGNWMLYACITVASFALSLLEVNFLHNTYGVDWWEPQLTIGSIFMAYGIFGWSYHLKLKPNVFSKMGAKYSLLIYLYHPFVYYLFKVIGNNTLSYENQLTVEQFNPLIGFVFTLSGIYFLDKYTPKIFRFLDGSDLKLAREGA